MRRKGRGRQCFRVPDLAPRRGARRQSASTLSLYHGEMSKSRATKQQAPARAPGGRQLIVSRDELLADGSDATFRTMVHNLFALLARHEAIRANHGRLLGLTSVEYTCLVTLGYLLAGGNVSVKMLADHLYVSGAFATTTVGRLIQAGLVDKQVDGQDRRRVSLRITERGQAVLREHTPLQQQVNDVRFGCMSRADLLQFSGTLERLITCADHALALQSYMLSQRGLIQALAASDRAP